jgi:hypothetical protein
MIGSDDAPLVVVGETSEAAAPSPGPHPIPTPPAVPADEGRSFFRRWPLWGGLALAFTGAGVVFALQVQGSEDELHRLATDGQPHEYREIQDEIDRGRLMAPLTNVGFGLAVGAAAAATWFFIDERRGRAAVGAAPIPGGAAVFVTGEL